MKVKIKGRDGTYTATEAVIHGWHTSVFIEELDAWVNSVEIVSKAFDREFDKALAFFDRYPKQDYYGIFVKDYC